MRAFILGNGPSLLKTPFDLLKDEVTFAMNRIDLILDRDEKNGIEGTDWRPTHYLYVEHLWTPEPGMEAPPIEDASWTRWVRRFILEGSHCIIRRGRNGDDSWREKIHADLASADWPNITWIDSRECHPMGVHDLKRLEEWHLPALCRYGGSMNIALQTAFSLGYDPVHLIGCDLGYKKLTKRMRKDPNHFHPRYWTYYDHSPETLEAHQVHVHEIARMEYEKMGRQIYNATIGGKLEVYERRDLMEVLNE